MGKRFDFKAQLKQGAAAEEIFASLCPFLERTDGRRGDFKFKSGKNKGAIVELKSESRTTEETPNFFFERYSSIAKKNPGGVWQTAQHGGTFFVILFACGTAFWFKVSELLSALEEIISKEKPYLISIRNNGYSTGGFKINRDKLIHLAIQRKYKL